MRLATIAVLALASAWIGRDPASAATDDGSDALVVVALRHGGEVLLCLDAKPGNHINGPFGVTVNARPSGFRTHFPIKLETEQDTFETPLAVPLALAPDPRRAASVVVEAGICSEDSCDPASVVVRLPALDTKAFACPTKAP